MKNVVETTIPTSCCTTQVKIAGRLIWASHTGYTNTLCLMSMVTWKGPLWVFWIHTCWAVWMEPLAQQLLCGHSFGLAMLWGSVSSHAVFSPCSFLLFPGDIEVDVPMPGVPSGPVPWWLSLSRAAQVYQLLCQGVWLYAPLVHTVQGGLCALQDPPAPWQDQVLQVHLGPCQFWRDHEWSEESCSTVPRHWRTLGTSVGRGSDPLLGKAAGRVEGSSCLYLEVSHTGPSILVSRLGASARGTDWWWTLRTMGLSGVSSS